MNTSSKPELLILAPRFEIEHPNKNWMPAPSGYLYEDEYTYRDMIEEFVDMGVYFQFDEKQQLPEELPEDLGGIKCIIIDSKRIEEFQNGENAKILHDYQANGGYVRIGLTGGDMSRMHVHRTMATANLQAHHPAMIELLQDADEDRLFSWWLSKIPQKSEDFSYYAWGDPAAYHFYWPVFEAAQYVKKPELMDPLWASMESAIKQRPNHPIACGKRFALKLYEKTGNREILELVLSSVHSSRSWLHDGVSVNMDYTAPEGVRRDRLPASVSDNLWVWPETAGNLGDSLGYLSKITGDASYAEQAVKQVLTTHEWCFDQDTALWYHIGRPDGPDLRSAPWGRGCGWVLYGVRGLLEDLPEEHPSRGDLVQVLRDGLEGWFRWQDEFGLWHNVIDEDIAHSRQDSCVTWMVINTYARAYWKGWLRDERVPVMLEKAWSGLKTKVWRGLPIAHCDGTSYSMSRQTYLARGHHRFFGGAVLLAYIELERMRECMDSDRGQQ